MRSIILFLLSIIYLKSFPVLIYDSDPTVLFAFVSALSVVAIAVGFNLHTTKSTLEWADIPRNQRPLLPKGYLSATLLAVSASVVLIYLTAIGFSPRFANRADLDDPYLDELLVFVVFASAPTLSHCVSFFFELRGMAKIIDDQE